MSRTSTKTLLPLMMALFSDAVYALAIMRTPVIAGIPMFSVQATLDRTAVSASGVPATEYAIYPGVDMYGSDLFNIDNLSEIGCLQACTAHSGCVGYVFAPYGYRDSGATACFLKSGVTQSTIQVAYGEPLNFGQVGTCGQVTTPSPACYQVTM